MMSDITPEQSAQCILVQQEALELVSRLRGEGFGWPAITAGISAALAGSITSIAGAGAVAPFFTANADLANRHLAK